MSDSPEVKQPSTPRRGYRLAIGGVILLFVGLFTGVWYVLSTVSADSTAQAQRTESAAVARQAVAVADFFAPIKKQLADLAADPAIIKLFETGDTNALAQAAGRRAGQFPSALKLRLLIPGNYELDDAAKPPLGFASLAMLNRAESTADVINPEVLLLGSDNAHIVFIRRVKDTAGKLIGLIHLSLGIDLLQQSLAGISAPAAYLELQQAVGDRILVLASRGDAGLKQGEPVTSAVQGTGWNLAIWRGAAPANAVSDGMNRTLITGIIVLVIGLTAILLWLSRRRQRPAADVAEDGAEAGTGVIYAGAIQAIMEGKHPGMEKLVPNLESIQSLSGEIKPLSQGLVGDDITLIAGAEELKAQAEQGDFFDLTGGSGVHPSEAITEPKLKAVEVAGAAGEAAARPELSPTIFRTYDIRGVVGRDLTPEIVQLLGRSIGSEAAVREQHTVIVGRDGRNSSPELAAALITGLRTAGRNVIDLGMVPTPVLYYATHTLDSASGVMLTGSHNGPDYNGLKIVLAGETLSESAVQALYQRIVAEDFATGFGELNTHEILADYIRRVTEDIPVALGNAFKLVVDCGNGVAGILAPQLYRALGHDVVELFCKVDGNFPNHHPDPSQPENLQALIDKVREEQADLGFAFDGDADRLGVVDGDGNIIWPDRQLMILARDVLTRNPGAEIIYDVKCSRHLKSIIEAGGGKPLMWKTGHSLIKAKMKEINAPLAGEMSGHIFFKERWYGFDDALYTGARLLEVLLASKTKPAAVFAEIPDAVSTPELRVDLPEDSHRAFMEALKDKLDFPTAEVFTVDGYRIEFPDGWGLVRPSNTTPCLILRFEADNQEALARIQSDFHQLLLSVKPDLSLPF